MSATLGATRVVDADSHIIEPPDLFTSSVSKKWGDLVPHVRRNAEGTEDLWYMGDTPLSPAGFFALVGWSDVFPSYPPTLEDIDDSFYDPHHRLKLLDEAGIQCQVIYPNLVGGFFANMFMNVDPKFALECTQAYNDYMTEFCSADPSRLIALTTLPFWDVEASVAEMERCKEAGHKGVLFAHTFEKIGLPNIPDEHWKPILEACQGLEQTMNFHVGFNSAPPEGGVPDDAIARLLQDVKETSRAEIAAASFTAFFSSAQCMSMLLFHGVCHRYPRLNFVSVESGFGFVPFLLQGADWQYLANGLDKEHPDWLLPSEYFKRQVYATMWFEKPAVAHVEEFQDNLMWETDFPHPTAQWPTPASSVALPAQEAIAGSFEGVSKEALDKVLYGNAAKLYHLS
jgi:uncharacterized protein